MNNELVKSVMGKKHNLIFSNQLPNKIENDKIFQRNHIIIYDIE